MSVTPTLRWSVLERDNFTCQYCGHSAPHVKLQADHIVPRSKGGRDTFHNLITACATCNACKSDKELISSNYSYLNDLDYVLGNYTDSPVEAMRLVKKVRNEAVEKLIENIDYAWIFTIGHVAQVMSPCNFEWYLLASLYDQRHIEQAIETVANELEQGIFPPQPQRVLTRVGQYAEAYHREFYGEETEE